MSETVSLARYREWGAGGGRTTAARRTPQQRQEAARHAHLASAVSAIARRPGDLTPLQIQQLAGAAVYVKACHDRFRLSGHPASGSTRTLPVQPSEFRQRHPGSPMSFVSGLNH